MSQYFPKPPVRYSNYATKTDLSYFKGKNYFDEDGAQNYLVFQSTLKYLTLNDNNKYITKWKSKGLSNEDLEFVYASRAIITPEINYNENKLWLNFIGSILHQKKITYNHKNVVNLYVVYEITKFRFDNNPILTNALFGAVRVTKNANINKYKYSGYGIGFDSQRFYIRPSGGIRIWSRYEFIN